MLKINLVAACHHGTYGIGKNNSLPWGNIPIDMYFFMDLTIGRANATDDTITRGKNAVIMGRKTHNSMNNRHLKDRYNYVLTRDTNIIDNVLYFSSVDDILLDISKKDVRDVFVIGGNEIYNLFLDRYRKYIDTFYVNFLHTGEEFFTRSDFDTFLTDKLHQLKKVSSTFKYDCKTGIIVEFTKWVNGSDEYNYLDLCKTVLEKGEYRSNRTGVNTFSTFGEKLVFDITHCIPILTTKKVPWKTILRELLWFISGSTNNKILQLQNVHIWDGNSTKEYLTSVGLKNEEGDLGPIYGYQWRHFGAVYSDCNSDYSNKGIDQLKGVIEMIKKDPTSRRIILSAWNPSQLHLMALPPCHILCQWYVRDTKYLDCQLYQRSGDLALGVPFNIASYSFLTYMIAHLTRLTPGKFIHILGDAHVYENHKSGLMEQFERRPYLFPTLKFRRVVSDIDDFKEDDFIVSDYRHHDPIKMDMAI